MRLVSVELKRLAARKLIWMTIIAAVAVAAVVVSGVFTQARQIDRARAGFDQQYQQMVEDLDEQKEMCQLEEDREKRRSGDPSIDFGCEQMTVPTIDEMYGKMPPLDEQYRMLLGGLAYPFMFIALAMGSTAVAAEFAHRTMGSWLTFEPRRTPVFLSKILAPGLAAVPMVVAGLVTVLVGVPAVFRWFRIDDAVTGTQWVSLGWMSLRIVVITVLAALFGAAAGFLLRHSGLVIGLMVGYLVLVEGILSVIFGWLAKLALGRNISAVVNNGTTWSTWRDRCDGGPETCEIIHKLSFTHGVLTLSVVLAIVVLLAWVRFTRDDVD